MASQHFIDKPIQLKQCTRCKSYVFLCTDAGTQVAADVKPLSVEEYRAAIIAGRYTFDLVTQAGRPYMLRMRGASSKWPPYEGRSVLAEHPCTRSINMAGVDLIDPPAQPRVNVIGQHGETQASSALSALGSNSQVHHANYATLRPSECMSCSKAIRDGELYWGIEHAGKWEWVEHVDCK